MGILPQLGDAGRSMACVCGVDPRRRPEKRTGADKAIRAKDASARVFRAVQLRERFRRLVAMMIHPQ